MKLPNIQDIDIAGKKVLLRVDLDVPLTQQLTIHNSQLTIQDDTRLKAGLDTIEYLLNNNAKVIVVGHLGRPEGVNKTLSLEPIAEWLRDNFQFSIFNFQKIDGFDGWRLSENLFLLENLRFFPEEEANDPVFAKKLASLADIYVNDAMAVIHREHASVVGIAELLPHYAGLHLQKEIEVLNGTLENPKRPLVVIIGGAKVETKMPLINKMQELADFVLVGGKLPQEEAVQNIYGEKVIVAQLTPDANDITPESAGRFKQIIATAGTIIWNGPLGLIKDDSIDTERGTREVAMAIAQSNAYKVVGGGDTIDCLKKMGLLDKFDFVSMGGGAMLAFLSGENLPGLAALEK